MTFENLSPLLPILAIGTALVALRINPIRALRKIAVKSDPKHEALWDDYAVLLAKSQDWLR